MNISKKINTGIIKFTFTDEDGEVFAYFRMNPTDVNLFKRLEEVSRYFESRKNEAPTLASVEDLVKYNKEIEEKIDYLLGYHASETLFDNITATTITPYGEIFAILVLEFISEKLRPEMQKRKQNMIAAADKYTEKYKK